jgi:mRNA interferase MazF
VAPLTRADRGVPFHVPVHPPEGGVRARSFILCDAMRSISTDRLSGRPWGVISAATLTIVEDRLRVLLEL